MTDWILSLPPWARGLVVVAVATALSVWVITTILPNPMRRAVEANSTLLEHHLSMSAQQRELERLMCHGISVLAKLDPEQCDRAIAGTGEP